MTSQKPHFALTTAITSTRLCPLAFAKHPPHSNPPWIKFSNLSFANLRLFFFIFYDILVFSNTLQEHLTHLQLILIKLLEAQFFLKKSKCLFRQRQLEYLGHIISQKGIQADPSKLQAMVECLQPTSTTLLRGFLGLTGFYGKFIKGYASIASPLTNLLKKDSFMWSPEAEHSFQTLKKAMTEAPTLAVPDFTIPFDLETDASGKAMGAVLMQENHPIAFFSKQFCPHLLRSSTYVRELQAITTAVKKWRQYLLGHPFTIHHSPFTPTTKASRSSSPRWFKHPNSRYISQNFLVTILKFNLNLENLTWWPTPYLELTLPASV